MAQIWTLLFLVKTYYCGLPNYLYANLFILQIYSLDQIQVQVAILTAGSINDKFCRGHGLDVGCARRLKNELMGRHEASNGKLLVLVYLPCV